MIKVDRTPHFSSIIYKGRVRYFRFAKNTDSATRIIYNTI